MNLAIGAIVDSRYKVIQVIGSGANGAVYKVEDCTLHPGTFYALKELAPVSPGPGDKKRFEREAKLLANLDHPNLPKVHNYFDDNYKFYLVMDYINGENLDKLLLKNPRGFSEKVVTRWLATLLDILEYLHANHVIFRDIKPANIIIDASGKVYLTDAGIAIEKSQNSSSVITSGPMAMTQAIGTPEYAAPEQSTQADERTDIYNLGATIFHLLTGTEPTYYGLPMRKISTLRPDISGELATIVEKMTQYHFSDRFQSVQEIKTNLRLNGTIRLPSLRKIEDQDFENIINKYWQDFSHIQNAKTSMILGQLRELLNKSLLDEAISKINQLLAMLECVGWANTMKNDLTSILNHCLIGLQIKTGSSQVGATIKRIGRNGADIEDKILYIEYLVSIGKLKQAKDATLKILRKCPQTNYATVCDKLKEIIDKIERKKQDWPRKVKYYKMRVQQSVGNFVQSVASNRVINRVFKWFFNKNQWDPKSLLRLVTELSDWLILIICLSFSQVLTDLLITSKFGILEAGWVPYIRFLLTLLAYLCIFLIGCLINSWINHYMNDAEWPILALLALFLALSVWGCLSLNTVNSGCAEWGPKAEIKLGIVAPPSASPTFTPTIVPSTATPPAVQLHGVISPTHKKMTPIMPSSKTIAPTATPKPSATNKQYRRIYHSRQTAPIQSWEEIKISKEIFIESLPIIAKLLAPVAGFLAMIWLATGMKIY